MIGNFLPSFLSGKSGFVRANLPRVGLWIAAAAVLIGLIWVVVGSYLQEQREQAERTAMGDAAVLARAHAKHLFRSLEAVDQLSLIVKHGWETSGGDLSLEYLPTPQFVDREVGFFISIIDERGNLVTSTIPEAGGINIVDEPYFKVHQENSDDFFYVGTARIGNFSQTPVVPFSRKILRSDGSFAGIVLLSVDPEHFISGYDELALKKYGLLAIFSDDRHLRLARVGDQVFLPHEDAQVILDEPPFEPASGVQRWNGERWFADARNRYVAWHPTEGYGMFTMTGVDQEGALQQLNAHRALALRNAWLATLAVLVLTLGGVSLTLRLAWRKYQLEMIQSTYRAATEGSNEGFFIARPIPAENGRVADFCFVDCNDRGAHLLNYRRSELLGKNMAAVFPEEAAALGVRLLCKSMKAGFYEGEADFRPFGRADAAWVRIRAVRQGDDLAVTLRDITEAKEHLAELERRGNEDALTGLPNRHWANAFLPQALVAAHENGQRLALLFVDLDGFKRVNDTAGHAAGDEVLRHAARRLRDAMRPEDHVVRMGGDEFLLILEAVHGPHDAAAVAERVLHAFVPPFKTGQGVHTLGASVGISLFPGDGADATELLKHADIAMYSAKTGGKGGYRFFDPVFSDLLQARHQREADLRHAIAQRQFIVHYQPRVDVRSGAVTSLEALVRWAHPQRGLVSPLEFIPLAEETGLIVPLGELVIDAVCAQLGHWARHDHPLVPVSVNVSARQFQEVDVPRLLKTYLDRYRVPAELVEVELTESSMIEDGNNVSEALLALQRMGIKRLVDDFGTGYSSLAQLQRLDFDVLKVDRAFTAQLEKTPEGAVFFTAIITMAHALGMRVVAEGVESEAQMRSLSGLQCDEVQGFLYSRPLPAEELAAVFRAQHWRLAY